MESLALKFRHSYDSEKSAHFVVSSCCLFNLLLKLIRIFFINSNTRGSLFRVKL